ncbi:unnamed protein product, partial [Adineta steineri]
MCIYSNSVISLEQDRSKPDETEDQHETYDFIQLCLTPDVNERPLFKALLDHPYPH